MKKRNPIYGLIYCLCGSGKDDDDQEGIVDVERQLSPVACRGRFRTSAAF